MAVAKWTACSAILRAFTSPITASRGTVVLDTGAVAALRISLPLPIKSTAVASDKRPWDAAAALMPASPFRASFCAVAAFCSSAQPQMFVMVRLKLPRPSPFPVPLYTTASSDGVAALLAMPALSKPLATDTFSVYVVIKTTAARLPARLYVP